MLFALSNKCINAFFDELWEMWLKNNLSDISLNNWVASVVQIKSLQRDTPDIPNKYLLYKVHILSHTTTKTKQRYPRHMKDVL